jgi:hypothetical protein
VLTFLTILCPLPGVGWLSAVVCVLAVAAFHAIGITEKDSAWTNLAFIGSGVVVGLLAGKYCTNPTYYPTVIRWER